MLAVPLLAMFLSGAAAALVAAAAMWRVKHCGTRAGIAVASLVLFFLLFIALFYLLAATIPTIDVAGGNECWNVPEKATDIYAKGSFISFGAEFKIAEADFVEYCRGRGWALAEIKTAVILLSFRAWDRTEAEPKEVVVRTGLVHDGATHRGGFLVAFDRESGKGYLNFAAR